MNKKDEKKIANQLSEMMFKDENLAKEDRTSEIMEYLENLDNIEIRDRYERTLLINAVCFNQKKIVKYLIDKGANLNAQDKIGFSALHFAAQNGFIEIANVLLENGAYVDLIDIYGNTPLGKAVYNYHDNGDLIVLLLKHGADRNIKNANGISPKDLANNISNYNISQLFN